MKSRRNAVACLGLSFLMILHIPHIASADPARPKQIVEDSLETMELLLKRAEKSVRKSVRRSKGVYILPSVRQYGLIFFGKTVGEGVLLRNTGDKWSYPAFIETRNHSAGGKLGFSDSAWVFVLATENGWNSVANLESEFDTGVTAVVGGLEGGLYLGNEIQGADIVLIRVHRTGLLASVDLLEISERSELREFNRQYYGNQDVGIRDIFSSDGQAKNHHSDPLRMTLSQF